MAVLPDHVNERSEAYQANRAHLLELLAEHDGQLALANGGGGEQYVARHRQRGKLLARERRRAAARPRLARSSSSRRSPRGAPTSPSARAVHRHRRRRGRRVPDHRQRPDGARRRENPWTLRKNLRAHARSPRRTACRSCNLVESGGADLPDQSEIFIPGGQSFHDLTELSARGIPTIASCSATPPPAAPTCRG